MSFIMGGFECAAQLRPDGGRVDVIAATRHDALAARDYAALAARGIRAARDGLRWHLVETCPGRYDWSSWLPQLRAARDAGVRVVWDLLHWGLPDDLDFWSAAFVDRFAAFARAAARVHAAELDEAPLWVAVNEISYWAFAGGHVAYLPPFAAGRGWEVKHQAVRAALAATAACRAVDARARFLTSEPLIAVHPAGPGEAAAAEARGAHAAQYEAIDMLLGRAAPELGGAEDTVDAVGCNYYVQNQWALHGPTLTPGTLHYRALAKLLAETHARYARPLYISETGCEGSFRPAWLRYVADEAAAARAAGVPVAGLCLYPVLNHPGWDDDRHCPNGLFNFDDARTPDPALDAEVGAQVARFADALPFDEAIRG